MRYPDLLTTSKKIGILGGSFNPLHLGHLEMLQIVIKKKLVSEVLLIPNYKNPLEKKNYYLPVAIRLNILKKVFKQHSASHIWDYETSQKRAVPTFETLCLLHDKFPEKKFYLVMGGDTFTQLPKWYKSQKLLEVANFIVFSRKNFATFTKIQKMKKEVLFLKETISDIQSSHLRQKEQNYECYAQELESYFNKLMLSTPNETR